MNELTGQPVCDFVWQYESRKKWRNFPDEEMRSINESVSKNIYSVQVDLENLAENFVNTKTMEKIHVKSSYKQRVRCVITCSNPHVWIYKTKTNDWNCFHPELSYILELAYQKKETNFRIIQYEFNLDTFKAFICNEKDSFSFKRENAEINHTNEVKAIIQKNELHFEKALSQDLASTIKLLEAVTNYPSDKGQKRKRNLIVDDKEDNLVLFCLSKDVDDLKTAVDNECPDKRDFHVYIKDTAFSATLNQTNLQNNNNKFYIIQLLEHDSKKKYCVWRRWGRVGQKGQTNLNSYGTNVADALNEFKKKFYDKTRNHWEEKEKFVHVKGKYDLLEINLAPQVDRKTFYVPSKLTVELKALMTLICDTKRMEEIMKEMCYDSNKTPLGELTLSQVKSGYIALNKITTILQQGYTHSELINACNDFYTRVPHNFGMKTPPIIKTQADIESKQRMLEALTNITVAMDVMNSDTNVAEHPLDKYYRTLNCSLDIIEPGCLEYMEIQKCIQETHGPTHNSYTLEIVHIFKCFKQQDTSVIADNKFILWHGSRIINWLGILKEGLRIAPPEAPRTGYMFGKGIYFADVCTKSANYCYSTKRKNESLLLLSEVTLGKQYPLLEADENMPENLPLGYDSVFGKGRVSPTDFKTNVLSPFAKIPNGPLVENPNHEGSLHYNEYIVYNANQVKMKYLVWVKFNFI